MLLCCCPGRAYALNVCGLAVGVVNRSWGGRKGGELCVVFGGGVSLSLSPLCPFFLASLLPPLLREGFSLASALSLIALFNKVVCSSNQHHNTSATPTNSSTPSTHRSRPCPRPLRLRRERESGRTQKSKNPSSLSARASLHTTTTMSSGGTVERPSEPLLGVDESKDITAFYHNTAYRVRHPGESSGAPTAPTAVFSSPPLHRARDRDHPPPLLCLLLWLTTTLPPPSTKLTHEQTQTKQRRAASPSTSRR